MLKSIHPLLNADVLHALAAMGHGDTLVLCDANFPAESVARQTTLGKLLRIDGASTPDVAEAVLSLMPLDTFVDDAAKCMAVVGSPDERPAVQQEVQAIIDASESESFPLVPVERFAFYEQAKQAYAVIASGEPRFFGCFILTKGVIAPRD
ncbi:RbsD/FucU family protein [Granulosicoccus sp. 3-233]|uniref:RbsD/FucU family protein n=1 Tax=Granulosicoccus sp. 3-233 TaxID=3417969 RepID=UPI003D3345F2